MSDNHKFRIITVSYYEVTSEQLASAYQTDDPVEAAQLDQSRYRESPELLDHLAEEHEANKLDVYVQHFDPGQQMFPDEFIREVIQILAIGGFALRDIREGLRKATDE